VYKSDLAPAAKMDEEKLTDASCEDEECGWTVDEDETGRAERDISRASTSRVAMNSEWTLRRCVERDWRAVERSWKKAVSERRGMVISLVPSVAELSDKTLPMRHELKFVKIEISTYFGLVIWV
jgi:hypothetical protein